MDLTHCLSDRSECCRRALLLHWQSTLSVATLRELTRSTLSFLNGTIVDCYCLPLVTVDYVSISGSSFAVTAWVIFYTVLFNYCDGRENFLCCCCCCCCCFVVVLFVCVCVKKIFLPSQPRSLHEGKLR